MGTRVNRRTELRDPNHHEPHPVHKRLASLQTEPKGTVDLLWFNSIISEQQPSLLRQRTCDVPTGEEGTAFANSLQQSQHTCAVEPQARALVLPLSNASPGCNVIVENVDPAFFRIRFWLDAFETGPADDYLVPVSFIAWRALDCTAASRTGCGGGLVRAQVHRGVQSVVWAASARKTAATCNTQRPCGPHLRKDNSASLTPHALSAGQIEGFNTKSRMDGVR